MSDLISRQAAIDALQNLAYNDWNKGTSTSWGDAFTECAEIISGLPSAQSEQKKGEWIKCGCWSKDIGMGEIHGHYYKCSECGIEVQDGYEQCGFNYCPNCGAKMVVNDT